jgi:hypothetical protein
MTPKEKARELIEIFSDASTVKECATIAVNEVVISAIDWHEYETPNKELNYWLEVRKEIQNL